jgi:hypothetical protein
MAANGKGRAIRVPEALWTAAKAKADERGAKSLGAAIREFLEAYVKSTRPAVKDGVGVMRARSGAAQREVHTFYVSDTLWNEAHEKAESVGETLSAAILTYLIAYAGSNYED